MSRTYRNNPIRTRSSWRLEPRGDSKPWNERFVTRIDKKLLWRCRCSDYCIPGKMHKYRRTCFPILWELKQVD